MASRARQIVERFEGFAFDAVLVFVAIAVSEQVVQDWLFDHPGALYHGLVALHLVAIPALMVAVVVGYGKAEREMMKSSTTPLGWAFVFVLCGSFIVPGVLGLIFMAEVGEMMLAVFGPMVGFALWMWALVKAEKWGWVEPARVGVPKPWWGVQGLALISWAYLIWLETMLLVAASKQGPLTQVGVPLGVLIDYLPIRVVLLYVRDASRWEIVTIAASVLHLLYRLASA